MQRMSSGISILGHKLDNIIVKVGRQMKTTTEKLQSTKIVQKLTIFNCAIKSSVVTTFFT